MRPPSAWRGPGASSATLSFQLGSQPAPDATADHDELTVLSDALALGLWIERDVYDWLLEDGGPGFERLMQREIERWNAVLERAVYPTSLGGVSDRIRLERVVVVPDGQRPANEELDTDLQWFFPKDLLRAGSFRRLAREQRHLELG